MAYLTVPFRTKLLGGDFASVVNVATRALTTSGRGGLAATRCSRVHSGYFCTKVDEIGLIVLVLSIVSSRRGLSGIVGERGQVIRVASRVGERTRAGGRHGNTQAEKRKRPKPRKRQQSHHKRMVHPVTRFLLLFRLEISTLPFSAA